MDTVRLTVYLFSGISWIKSSFFSEMAVEFPHMVTSISQNFQDWNANDIQKPLDAPYWDIMILEIPERLEQLTLLFERFPRAKIICVGKSITNETIQDCLNKGAYEIVSFVDENDLQQRLFQLINRTYNHTIKELYYEGLVAEKENRFVELVQALPDIVYRLDKNGEFVYLNAAVSQIGYTPEELIGKHFSTIIEPADIPLISRTEVLSQFFGKITGSDHAPKLFDERRRGSRKTENLEVHLTAKRRNGMKIVGSVTAFGEVNANGFYTEISPSNIQFSGTVGIIRDITARRQAESHLRRLFQAIEQSSIYTLMFNTDMELIYANTAFYYTFRFNPLNCLNISINELSKSISCSKLPKMVKACIEEGSNWDEELVFSPSQQEPIITSAMLSPVYDPDGLIQHCLVLLKDISETRRAEQKIQFLAFNDELTGLPNRKMLWDYLGSRAGDPKKKHTRIAVLFVDINNFKAINAQYGQEAGNATLKEVAQRLSRHVRTTDILARFGGDQFVGIINDLKQEESAVLVAENFISSCRKPVQLGQDDEITISISVGIAFYPDDSEDPETLVQQADDASYRAKLRKSSTPVIYHE